MSDRDRYADAWVRLRLGRAPQRVSHTISYAMLASATTQTYNALAQQIALGARASLRGYVEVLAHISPASHMLTIVVAETGPRYGVDVNTPDLEQTVLAALVGRTAPTAQTPTLQYTSGALGSATGSFSGSPIAVTGVTSQATTVTASQAFQFLKVTTSMPGPPKSTLPPAPEPMWSPIPVYGFRAWKADDAGMLRGRVVMWHTSRLEATCHSTTLSREAKLAGDAPAEHAAPHWGCHCGVYVCDDPNHQSVAAARSLTPDFWPFATASVVGIVELTGTIIQHEEGARGAVGEIRHLWVPETYAESVQGTYPDVPVTTVHWQTPWEWAEEAEDGEAAVTVLATDQKRRLLTEDMIETKKRMEEKWLR